ncbi:MAG TPA: Rieske 2Fe-2S domain-containing protein [Candidatus Sulfotelmatobacter sp.]|nr:Rieske 2Fe-2S domain-containing protein [Candidatus Sulfotelmatobacter sp.]
MTAQRRRRLAAVEEVPLQEGRSVLVDGERVALFRCSDGFRAISARCPHAGGPLADGIVAGRTVTCPLHGRVVDLETGSVDDSEQGVRVYKVEVDSGSVFLEEDSG